MHQKIQSDSFFRAEVIGSYRQLDYGSIRLSQPISDWLAVGIALLVIFAFISYITLGSVARKERAAGIVVPVGGNITVYASGTGAVKKFLVSEGEQVKEGQPLFELSTERQSQSGEVSTLVAQQLLNRKASLETERQLRKIASTEKNETLQKKKMNLESSLTQIQQEVILAERRARLAQVSLFKYQTLQRNGFISDLQLQQKEEELIDVGTRLSNLKRETLQIQENILEVESEQKALVGTVATEKAQFDESLANIEQEMAENSSRKSTFITAPESGIVATIISQHGQVVGAGQILAILTPLAAEKSRLEAQLYVPSRTAGFISSGQTVLIRFDAFPYEKFGVHKGIVTDISKTPFAPNELPPNLASTILNTVSRRTPGFSGTEALYRIRVRLDQQGVLAYGKIHKLKPAMTLEADLVQERRRIWEWIAEPVFAVTQRQSSR